MEGQWWAWALRFLGIGWYIAFCILGGALGGLWLDRRLDTLPLFSLGGTLFGTFLAFYGLYRMLAPLIKQYGKTQNKGK